MVIVASFWGSIWFLKNFCLVILCIVCYILSGLIFTLDFNSVNLQAFCKLCLIIYQRFCLCFRFLLFLLGFALVLCLLHDCELLIFFTELFVSIFWGPGWWWAFPVWIYVCFGCVPGTTISSLLFWIIQIVWICNLSWGWLLSFSELIRDFLVLLSLGQNCGTYLIFLAPEVHPFTSPLGNGVCYFDSHAGSGLHSQFFRISEAMETKAEID